MAICARRWVVSLLLLTAGGAEANDEVPAPATGEKVAPKVDAAILPNAFVASGGISLGAYQAGVSYAFLRYLKDNQDTLGPLEVATGASAGNINAFLAAIHWLEKSGPYAPPFSATRNLFWDTWINVGFDRLSPSDRSDHNVAVRFARDACDVSAPGGSGSAPPPTGSFYSSADGLVGRQAFEPATALISTRLAQKNFGTGSVRVGVTITSEEPRPVDAGGASGIAELGVMSQRHVVMLEANTPAEDPGGIRFENYCPQGTCQPWPKGDVIALPHSQGSPGLNEANLLNVIKASSAFPVAFSPVTLCARRRDPGTGAFKAFAMPPNANPAGDPLATCGGDRIRFFDGGTFDNVPIGLAHDLSRNQQARTRYLYVHPDLRRRGTSSVEVGGGKKGVGYLAGVLGHFIDEGRNYELLAIERGLVPVKNNQFLISNRFYPVAGEYLGAFGAFFQLNYRIHDYLIGLYDGIYALARTQWASKNGRTGAPSTHDERRAFWREFALVRDALVLDTDHVPRGLDLGEDCRAAFQSTPAIPLKQFINSLLVHEVRTSEAGNATQLADLESDIQLQVTFLGRAVDQPSGALAEQLGNGQTPSGWHEDPVWIVHRALRGLDQEQRLAELRGTREERLAANERATSFLTFLDRLPLSLHPDDGRTDVRTLEKPFWFVPPPDAAEPALTVHGESTWYVSTIERLLRRAGAVEDADRRKREDPGRRFEVEQYRWKPVHPSLIGLARGAVAWATERDFEQWDLDPGSSRRLFGMGVHQLLPNFAAKTVTDCQLDLGWFEPKYRFWPGGVFLSGSAGLHLAVCEENAAQRVGSGWRAGVGAGVDPTGRLFDDLQVQLMSWHDGFGAPFAGGARWGLEGSVEVATKLRLAVGFRAAPTGEFLSSVQHSTFIASVGVSDLNTLIAAPIAFLLGTERLTFDERSPEHER